MHVGQALHVELSHKSRAQHSDGNITHNDACSVLGWLQEKQQALAENERGPALQGLATFLPLFIQVPQALAVRFVKPLQLRGSIVITHELVTRQEHRLETARN